MKLHNVGYGANIIENNGKIYLFDAGTRQTGNTKVIPFLEENYPNLTKIERIFISHYHQNHTGGIIPIINRYEIGAIHSNGTFSDDPRPNYAEDPIIETEIDNLTQQLSIPYTFYKQGDTWAENGMEFIMWSPLTQHFTNGGRTTDPNGITGGIMQVKYGDFSAVFGGDIFRPHEVAEIWDVIGDVSTNVYFWPHHGDPNTAVDSIIDPMSLDAAVIESLGSSNVVIDYLTDKGIDYLWMYYTGRSSIQANVDGSFVKLTANTEEYFRPKGNLFIG